MILYFYFVSPTVITIIMLIMIIMIMMMIIIIRGGGRPLVQETPGADCHTPSKVAFGYMPCILPTTGFAVCGSKRAALVERFRLTLLSKQVSRRGFNEGFKDRGTVASSTLRLRGP